MIPAGTEPQRPQRLDARRSVASILEAARTLLAGDPSASMGAIAQAAGVHRATVHRHFPAREDLLAALHDRVRAECLVALDEAEALAAGPGERLRRLTAAWIRVGERYRLAEWRAVFAPDAVQAARRENVQERLQALFAAGAEAGELRSDVDPDLLPALWVGLLLGVGAAISAGRVGADEAADVVLRLLRT
jgi:AcrR family transcriptional regulator